MPSSLVQCIILLSIAPLHALTLGRSLLGKRALVMAGTDPCGSLQVADTLVQGGAFVELCVPLPPSSSCASGDDAAWRLRLRLQRQGFSSLMRELGYVGCDPRAERVGDPQRSRVSWSHVACDDREAVQLKLLDNDLLVWDRPPRGDGVAVLPPPEEGARRRMRMTLLATVLPVLRQRGLSLRSDAAARRLRWAWLDGGESP